ncbi:MAG: hypothetical protein ACP5Q5_05885 [Brevinematia bacterium]
MKKLFYQLIFYFIFGFSFGAEIFFPELFIYSEIDSASTMQSSYRINMSIDTGLKYNIFVGLGIKGYNIETMRSNFVEFSSFKIDTKPLENFNFNFFLGRAKTLGYSEFGYVGFQHHRREHFEYIGYKDISGSGVELATTFLETIEPHLYIYSSDDTNIVCSDMVWYYRGENFYLEFYGGLNTIDFYNAYVKNELLKRFGFFSYANFGKIELVIGIYSPDSKFDAPLVADDFYFHVSEKIKIGYFEQVLSVFSRPSSYNGYVESVSNDIDVYASMGVALNDMGFGLENTLSYSTSYELSDKIGLYSYFYFANLIYKLGFFYTLTGNAFEKYGVFLNISGNI